MPNQIGNANKTNMRTRISLSLKPLQSHDLVTTDKNAYATPDIPEELPPAEMAGVSTEAAPTLGEGEMTEV